MPAVSTGYTRDYHWQEDAACQSAPEVDKAALTGYPTREVASDVKRRYCDRCPVVNECLKWAYDEHFFTGVAGGKVFTSDRSNTGSRSRRIITLATRDVE